VPEHVLRADDVWSSSPSAIVNRAFVRERRGEVIHAVPVTERERGKLPDAAHVGTDPRREFGSGTQRRPRPGSRQVVDGDHLVARGTERAH